VPTAELDLGSGDVARTGRPVLDVVRAALAADPA
jgi:hypothetical protein